MSHVSVSVSAHLRSLAALLRCLQRLRARARAKCGNRSDAGVCIIVAMRLSRWFLTFRSVCSRATC